MIVSEFSEGDVLCPRSRVGVAEDLEVSFHFLIDLFSFPISLRMVCSGEGKFITKELFKFFSKGGGKLWSLVRDDFVVKTKSFEYFQEEERSNS